MGIFYEFSDRVFRRKLRHGRRFRESRVRRIMSDARLHRGGRLSGQCRRSAEQSGRDHRRR